MQFECGAVDLRILKLFVKEACLYSCHHCCPGNIYHDINWIAFFETLSFQVAKRPSIEELLEDPLVSGRRATLERKMSGQLQSSRDLRTWESELRALERDLEEKKRDIESVFKLRFRILK